MKWGEEGGEIESPRRENINATADCPQYLKKRKKESQTEQQACKRRVCVQDTVPSLLGGTDKQMIDDKVRRKTFRPLYRVGRCMLVKMGKQFVGRLEDAR